MTDARQHANPLPPALRPIAADLDRLAAIDRRRALVPIAGRDFASNDYLGLAGSPVLREAVADAIARGVPVGSGGSRLLRGNRTMKVSADSLRAFDSPNCPPLATIGININGEAKEKQRHRMTIELI